MTETVYAGLDELVAAQGVELGPTEWIPMEQTRVDAFADATEDHQWIHVDPARATDGPFGATVAHGFLTLSLVPYFNALLRRVEGVRMGINYGLNRVRFATPVRVGSRVRARSTMVSIEKIAPDAAHVVTRTTVEVEGRDKPGCVADLVARYYFLEQGSC
jgi:acyl dehydratase